MNYNKRIDSRVRLYNSAMASIYANFKFCNRNVFHTWLQVILFQASSGPVPWVECPLNVVGALLSTSSISLQSNEVQNHSVRQSKHGIEGDWKPDSL